MVEHSFIASVTRQVCCVGDTARDRLKMVEHRASATAIVPPKSVESMTMKGQIKPTFVARTTEGEEPKQRPEHTIVSIIITDLIF